MVRINYRETAIIRRVLSMSSPMRRLWARMLRSSVQVWIKTRLEPASRRAEIHTLNALPPRQPRRHRGHYAPII
jgi:hypothetical protein